jgi:hypothetical protein
MPVSSIKFKPDKQLMLDLVKEISSDYHLLLYRKLSNEYEINKKKEMKQQKFLKSKKRKLKPRDRMKLDLVLPLITQAITKGIPLRAPRRKKFSKPEISPLIYQTIENSELIKTKPKLASIDFESKVADIIFVPENIYLQRLDSDSSKILLKLVIPWGYLEENQLNLFLNEDGNEISENMVVVFNQDKSLQGIYPLKHSSNFQSDNEGSANALFVGLITDLEPNTKYWYRIECYYKNNKKIFACTNTIPFQSSFNLDERNKPLFLIANSDLHGGRNGKFMRGKVKGKIPTGNLDLAKVFNNIASTESEITFNEGYSIAVATGDLTENASYSEYWIDLIKRCTPVWNHVPVLTCIGNHDYYCGGFGKGHMAGGFEEDCRYWHRWITNPNSSSGNLPEHWYSIDQGNVHLVFLDSNGMGWGKYSLECGSEQWLWLEQDLRNWRTKIDAGEKAPQFCIVFLHSAILSLGFWGRGYNFGNDERVQSYLTPLFRKYGVNLVINGHDHIYQRSNFMNTTYLVNGRGGGSLRPFFFWKRNKTIYKIDRLCTDFKTRIFTTLYIPPNKKHMSNDEKNEFKKLKQKMKADLLKQPLASNYFFGLRSINKELGELFDKAPKIKEKLIENLILPKLDKHIWLRAYAVSNEYHSGYQEIVDMCFIKTLEQLEDYQVNCPEKVVE